MNFDCAKYVKNHKVDRECLIAKLEYSICLRLEAEMCKVKWTANYFDMGPDGVTASQRGDCNLISIEIIMKIVFKCFIYDLTVCQENYITIDNAHSETDTVQLNPKSFDRFCGTAFNIERNNRTNIPLISKSREILKLLSFSQYLMN